MKYIVNGDIVLSQPPDGPLGTQVEAFAEWAREQGYARCSRYRKVLLAACFSRWLSTQGIRLHDVSSEDTSRYLRSRVRRVLRRKDDAVALEQFLECLRRRHVIRAEKSAPCRVTAVERTARAFEQVGHPGRCRGWRTSHLGAQRREMLDGLVDAVVGDLVGGWLGAQ